MAIDVRFEMLYFGLETRFVLALLSPLITVAIYQALYRHTASSREDSVAPLICFFENWTEVRFGKDIIDAIRKTQLRENWLEGLHRLDRHGVTLVHDSG